jgi:hypothetical protein
MFDSPLPFLVLMPKKHPAPPAKAPNQEAYGNWLYKAKGGPCPVETINLLLVETTKRLYQITHRGMGGALYYETRCMAKLRILYGGLSGEGQKKDF